MKSSKTPIPGFMAGVFNNFSQVSLTPSAMYSVGDHSARWILGPPVEVDRSKNSVFPKNVLLSMLKPLTEVTLVAGFSKFLYHSHKWILKIFNKNFETCDKI